LAPLDYPCAFGRERIAQWARHEARPAGAMSPRRFGAHVCTRDCHPWGCCPECPAAPGEICIVHIGKWQWGVCTVHRVKWCVGYGLISTPWEVGEQFGWWDQLFSIADYRYQCPRSDGDAWKTTVAYLTKISPQN